MRRWGIIRVSMCLLLCWHASAQTLWQDTAYGMSVEEVRAVVPGAVSPTNPNSLQDGAEELLRLESFELVGEAFKGEFFFKDDKLVQVSFYLPEGYSANAGRRIFDSLTSALRAKYGQELSREVEENPGGRKAEATWLWGQTNIGLSLFSAGADFVLLKLEYQVKLVREADKL